MPPLFAFLDDAREAFNELVTNLLLVAGGFMVGYLIGWVGGWAIGKYALRQKDTSKLKALARPVCGIILALIVALIVFTGKGKPHGEGGDGKGTPNNDPNASKGGPPQTDPNRKDPKVDVPKIDDKPADVTIRVTIIAGAAVPGEGRFYLIDDDNRDYRLAKTFPELKRAVEERKAKAKGKVTLAIVFPTDPKIAPADRTAPEVKQWATEEAGLDVVFPATPK